MSSRVKAAALLLAGFFLFSGPVHAQELANLTGRVVNAGGEPAVDAEVRILALGLRVPVGESGQFMASDLPPGEYLLEASSLRFGQSVQRVLIEAGQTVSLILNHKLK